MPLILRPILYRTHSMYYLVLQMSKLKLMRLSDLLAS